MNTIRSFLPIADPGATRLILGSMPGDVSLTQQQYYAHPRNAFWAIMAALFQIDSDLSYTKRCLALEREGVAVWDVMQSCVRPGSLDAAIIEKSIVANDFSHFFQRHPKIHTIFFNGAKAEHAYNKYVLNTLPAPFRHLPSYRLPSTSPAHAALSIEQKCERWRDILSDEANL